MMRRRKLPLAILLLAAAPSPSWAGIILDGDVLTNNDSSSFVNPPPNSKRLFAPGSPSKNQVVDHSPTFSSTSTLPFNNAYTYLGPTGAPVGSVSSSLSAGVSYAQLGAGLFQITAFVVDSNEGHTLNNSGWRSTNTASNTAETEFTLTAPMYYLYHQTSAESETGAYTNVGTSGNLANVSVGTVVSGLSVLSAFGNEGVVPTLDLTMSG